jgi:hypothetical protein
MDLPGAQLVCHVLRVETDNGLVLVDSGFGSHDCGDAFYHPGTIDGRSRVPLVLRVQEELLAFDRKRVHANHERMAELRRRQEPDLPSSRATNTDHGKGN